MSDLEDQVRRALADPSWALPVPPDPAGWAKQRARRRPGRPLLSSLVAAGVAVGAGVLVPAALQPAEQPDRPLVAERSRDDVTLRVELDAARAVVGRRISGRLIVRNARAEPIRLLEGCSAPLRLSADYSAAVPPGPTAAGAAGRYRQLVLAGPPRATPGGPQSISVPSSHEVVRERRPCAAGQQDGTTQVAAGGTAEVKVDWVPESPGGAPVDVDLPMLAGVTYLLPDGPDDPVDGDPASRGSTTPGARVLDVGFSMPLSGGDAQRATLPTVIDSALADPRFRDVLEEVPADRWRWAWALPFDKPARDGQQVFSAGEADTDQLLGPAQTWYVVLDYAPDGDGPQERITALVDGTTAAVKDVTDTADEPADSASLPEAEARRLVGLLRRFAEDPSPATARQVPFAPAVRLGLGETVLEQAAAEELHDPGTWALPTGGGYEWIADPTVSALDLLDGSEPHTAVVGPHPHCAGPAKSAPTGLADAQRVSTQPNGITSCNAWYTVDMFLRDGKIVAVTLDLWEP